MNYDEVKACVRRECVDNDTDKALIAFKYTGSKDVAEKLLDVIVNVVVCVSNLKKEEIDIFFTNKIPH